MYIKFLKVIVLINNQFKNNQNLSHQIVSAVNEIFGWNLIKDGIVKAVNFLSTNKNIKMIKNDKITIFLLDYHMLTKRLKKYIILWLILLITQQKIWLVNYKV